MLVRLLLIVLLLSHAQVAQAQTGKTEYGKALRYFNAEEYETALPYFQKAYELSGHRPSTILMLAQCERALKRFDEALEHYREYLATNPSDAEQIAETVRLVEDLRGEAPAPKVEPEESPGGPRTLPEPPQVAPLPEPPQVAPPAPTPDPTPDQTSKLITAPPPEEGAFPVVPFVSTLVGATVAVTGIIVGVSAVSAAEDGDADGTLTQARVADGMLIGGLVWTGGSLAWLLLTD